MKTMSIHILQNKSSFLALTDSLKAFSDKIKRKELEAEVAKAVTVQKKNFKEEWDLQKIKYNKRKD